LKILDNIDSQHVFFDINLRQNYFDRAGIIKSLEYSSIVKLNDEEAFFLDDYLFNRQGSLAEFANRISSEYDIEILCITKGADGAEIYTKNEKHVIPGVKVQVADTIGAGDSFCAGFLAAFLASKTLQECGSLAVQIAGFVASQAGAVPEYSAALREVIKEAGLVLEKE
jgi:fructokinase